MLKRLLPAAAVARIIFLAMTIISVPALAQNPYLPLWEYIPDGEPYVFEDPDKPGEYRVYIYGSHDSLKDSYCGREQVVWSAPVNDLGNWRYDGVIFRSLTDRDGKLLDKESKGDVLFAPDVAVRMGKDGKKEYFLFPNVQNGERSSLIAKSSRPDGPFEVCNWSASDPGKAVGVFGFDPACFVDDDGRVYGYWGFNESYGAELDPETMCTVKQGCTIVPNMVSGHRQQGIFRFFEASSMRKIEDKYVFIYSRYTEEGEFGLPSVNYTLAYAYSDTPLGPFTYGGTLIDGRSRGIDDNGRPIPTANPYGNTHGSLCRINGKWWIFYHRQTGTDEYSRQAMVAPVDVKVERGKGGKVIISEGEYNSEGFCTEGLNPLHTSAAGWACYLTNPKGITQSYPHFNFSGSYIKSTRWNEDSYAGPFNLKQPWCPVVNNTSGSVVGYKYFNFDHTTKADHIEFTAHIKADGNPGKVTVMVGGPSKAQGGRAVASFDIGGTFSDEITEIRACADDLKGIKGKQALYFVFSSAVEDKSICELYDFRFETAGPSRRTP